MVAVLVPDLANPFFTALVAGLETRARAAGYDLIAASSAGDPGLERSRMEALLAWRPAGLVVVPATDRIALAAALAREGTPLVVVDRVAGPLDADTVAIEDRGAAADAVRHLLEHGRRRLLLLVSTRSIANMRARIAGAERALAEAGLGAAEVLECGFTAGEAAEALRHRLRRALPAPDAVFALLNHATLGALQALREAGLRIPADIALVGFDDEAWMPVADPPITAVRQPIDALGAEAWRLLSARIAGESHSPCRIRLGCTLEVRASTGAAAPSASDAEPERSVPSGQRAGRNRHERGTP